MSSSPSSSSSSRRRRAAAARRRRDDGPAEDEFCHVAAAQQRLEIDQEEAQAQEEAPKEVDQPAIEATAEELRPAKKKKRANPDDTSAPAAAAAPAAGASDALVRRIKAGLCKTDVDDRVRGFLDSMPSELAATALADFRELDAAGKLARLKTAPATSEARCGSGSGTTSGARASRGTRAHSAAAPRRRPWAAVAGRGRGGGGDGGGGGGRAADGGKGGRPTAAAGGRRRRRRLVDAGRRREHAVRQPAAVLGDEAGHCRLADAAHDGGGARPLGAHAEPRRRIVPRHGVRRRRRPRRARRRAPPPPNRDSRADAAAARSTCARATKSDLAARGK